MDGKVCFVCCNATTSIVSDENCWTARLRSSKLENSLDIIFILRNLLKVPSIQLECQLKESGDNPEEWISLCDQCIQLTDKARELHREVKNIEKQLKLIGKQILDKITLSSTDDNEEGGYQGNSIFQWKIRSLVKQNVLEWRKSDDDDHGGFLKGDKLAKFLASQQNSSKVKILMVENDVITSEKDIKEEEESPPPSPRPSPPPPIYPVEEEDPLNLSSCEVSEGEEDDDYEEEDKDEEYSVKITEKRNPRKGTGRRFPDSFECYECGNKFADDGTLKNHVMSVHGTNLQKYDNCICHCPHCGNQFGTRNALISHVKTKHLNNSFVACPICGKCFPGNRHSAVHLHILTTHKDHPVTLKLQKEKGLSLHKCPLGCRPLHLTKKGLDKHFTKWHLGVDRKSLVKKKSRITKDGKLECGPCGRIFSQPKSWSDHQWKAHSLEEIKCPVVDCGESFTEKGGNEFANHWTRIHKKQMDEKNGPWICEICGKESSCRKNLSSHRSSVHKIGEKRKQGLQILLDGKPVQVMEEKKKRRMREGEVPCICSLCGKMLKSKECLKAHVRFSHEKRFSLTCHVCGLGIQNKKRFNIHLLAVHAEDPVSKQLEEEEGLKLVRCEVTGCGSTFLKKEQLEEHVERLHKGEGEGGNDRFKCGVCGKGFWIRSKLREHEMSHDKNIERSLKCELCGNGFGTRTNLSCHMIKVHKIWKTKKSINVKL